MNPREMVDSRSRVKKIENGLEQTMPTSKNVLKEKEK